MLMKSMTKIIRLQRLMTALVALVVMACSLPVNAAMTSLEDTKLADYTGQAFFQADKQTVNGFTFYKAGLDATLELNANVKNLELGRTGAGNNVDLWAENVALGCTADNLGNCVDSSVATQLRDFVLERPYFEFAIENDSSVTNRSVVGVRFGAESAEGPFSIGQFKVYSGYLTATSNIELQEQGKGRNPDDVAITCGPSTGPCPNSGTAWNDGVNTFGLEEPLRSLGLNNDQACVLSICAQFRDLTVSFDAVQRNNLPVLLQGKRQTLAYISGANFNSAVEQLTGTLNIERSNSALSAGLINFILPIIEGQANNKIKGQLYTNLGLAATYGAWNNSGTQQAALEAYQIPYHVSNLHQVEVSSPLFGLSFQQKNVRYPGYAADMPVGWSMYLPDAFTLTVSQPTTRFVSNIANGNASAGYIIGLDPVFDNCWGSATFC